jgi:hypothetical protein
MHSHLLYCLAFLYIKQKLSAYRTFDYQTDFFRAIGLSIIEYTFFGLIRPLIIENTFLCYHWTIDYRTIDGRNHKKLSMLSTAHKAQYEEDCTSWNN